MIDDVSLEMKQQRFAEGGGRTRSENCIKNKVQGREDQGGGVASRLCQTQTQTDACSSNVLLSESA